MDAIVARRSGIPGATPYALVVLGLAAVTVGGAFAFQAAGYLPCELCLKERLPYYAGAIVAALTALAAWRGPTRVAQAGFVLLALVFVFSAGFGAYHAGVEWGFWAGPTDCTGPLDRAPSNHDFLQQLKTFKAVRCDAVAVRILGLSLAGWNAIISLALAAIAVLALYLTMLGESARAKLLRTTNSRRPSVS